MGFLKKFFTNQQHRSNTSTAATDAEGAQKEEIVCTPSTSNAATPITSPAGSIIDIDAQVKPIHDRYHNDPMRISKRPDTIGSFLDPMGGYGSYSVSKDVTNTGA